MPITKSSQLHTSVMYYTKEHHLIEGDVKPQCEKSTL